MAENKKKYDIEVVQEGFANGVGFVDGAKKLSFLIYLVRHFFTSTK